MFWMRKKEQGFSIAVKTPMAFIRVSEFDILLWPLTPTSHYCRLWKTVVMVQGIEFISFRWETWIMFLAQS